MKIKQDSNHDGSLPALTSAIPLRLGASAAILLLCGVASAQVLPPATSVEQMPRQIAAQDRANEAARPYVPAGAPLRPKVDAAWNRFRDYQQVTDLLKAMAKAHPDLCTLTSLGKSHGGREVWLMTITDRTGGSPESKPAQWLDGGIHANEVQTVDAVLYAAWYLLEMQTQNRKIADLLRRTTFYLVPMMSPDSRDAHMYQPNTTHSPRGGQIPYDSDHDGLKNEDRADDLDGDGNITQMRVRDPNGKYKPSDKYPELMVRVGPGEKGEYRLLGEEGYDNDGDGFVDENPDGDYDPNRDWPWQWQPGYVQYAATPYPLWVPTNRRVAEFILAHPNIGGSLTFHNAAGEVIRSPGPPDAKMSPQDVAVFDFLGKRGEMIMPGYRYIQLNTGLYPGYGVEMDWLYAMRGQVSYTVELYSPEAMFHRASAGLLGSGDDLHEFNKYLLMDEAWVPWHKVHHPQFGDVEVGGFKKNWVRQPASFLVEEELHRAMAFAVEAAEELPRVHVQSAVVVPLGGGLRQVTAVIQNTGLIPTRLRVDRDHHIGPPDRVTITGAGLHVVTGLIARDPMFRHVTEQKRNPAELRIDHIPGESAAYVRWLVTGDGPITIGVKSVHGGRDEMTVLEGPSRRADER